MEPTTGPRSRSAAACFSAVSSSRNQELAVVGAEWLAIDPDELGGELLARLGLEDRLDRPVLLRLERCDLALALHDQADGDRLDTTGRQARANLAPQQRAERVADQAIEDAPRLLGVDEVVVDLAWVGECVADCVGSDLGEGHSSRLLGLDVRRLGDVPGDGLALRGRGL